jgi:hypothetical protein
MNALIYSPSFAGHRQIYVFVLADILQKSGHAVYIAGNFSEKLINAFYIEKLKSDKSIIRIDTVDYEGHGQNISLDEVICLQKKYNINQTVFTEADNHIPLFNSQIFSGGKKILGRTCGIFLRPFYFYDKLNLIDKLRYIKRLKLKWKTDERFFFEILNPQFQLLDSSLYIDEYFVSKHRKTKWLPDVFQQYADKLVFEEQSEQRVWLERLNEFKNINKGQLFLLYFGTAQHRRGYDQLLKLAVDYKACFIHCGLRSGKNELNNNNVDELRNILEKENRLFETNEYITDPICIEYFFKSVSHLILPYNDFYGSSGVMLQALGYNIPVLVPDIGIIGYRVKKYNLGLTYSSESFGRQFLEFINTPKESYSESIESYMKLQSAYRLESILLQNFAN